MPVNLAQHTETDDGLLVTGTLVTANVQESFSLVPIPNDKPNAPTHDLRIKIEGVEQPISVGKAWQKKQGAQTKLPGAPFFSCQFSDPDLPEWSWMVFPTDDQGNYQVVVKRQRGAA